MEETVLTRAGFIAIVGRPNVGKSTLLNKILDKKISITSNKPQTTRHAIQGVKTVDNVQMIFVDTPGIHQKAKRALNRYMNKTARQALKDVDIILFVVDGVKWTQEDKIVLEEVKQAKGIKFLLINKVDTIADKAQLLPHIEALAKDNSFDEVLPISAEKGINIDVLSYKLMQLMPSSPFYFPLESLSNRSLEFHLAEMVREQLMRQLGAELPYSATVVIDEMVDETSVFRLSAIIWVERDSQKGIVIGDKGERLKSIGQKARLAMEEYMGKKVFLRLWVKVKENWSDDLASLEKMGYMDFD